MKGQQWIEALSKLDTHQLADLKKALETLKANPDIAREFSGEGLFDGFPSLLTIITRTLESKVKELDKGLVKYCTICHCMPCICTLEERPL